VAIGAEAPDAASVAHGAPTPDERESP